jgi:DNA-binding Lrp family transcriptional regulator
MSTILAAFNNHFEEFVADIQRVFPEDAEIKAAATALTRLRKANPSIIIKGFKSYVSIPYGDQIDAADISFFIQKDYSNDLGDQSPILEKINMLREPVSNMEEEDQTKVVKYLQNLKKLSELYN